MSIATPQQAFALAQALVHALDQRDHQALQRDFGLSPAVQEELYQTLADFFEADTRLSLAPEAQAFASEGRARPFIDTYITHAQTLGLECVLFADGAPSEALLHLEVREQDGQWALYCKYIGS